MTNPANTFKPLAEQELQRISARLKVDPSSPSGLTWIDPPKGRRVKPGSPAGYQVNAGHFRVQLLGKRYRVSHLVLYLSNIFPKEGQTEVDHIDRNPENNLVSNLRWTTRGGNLSNRGVMGVVPFRYVHRSRNKYCAQYTHPTSSRQIFVGRYALAYDAHLHAVTHRLENYWKLND